MVATGSGPVPRDHLGCSQLLIRFFRGREGMGQLGLQAVEGLQLRPLLVAPDQPGLFIQIVS